MAFIKANPVLSPGHPPGFTTGGKAPANPMKTKTNPNLLEIATSFALWQEYADPSGIDSEEQFDARSDSENLQLLQECGFHETLLVDLYSDDGFLQAENVKVQIRGASSGEKPIIRIGSHIVLTDDCEISADEITGPGGWYVIVRRLEGGAE